MREPWSIHRQRLERASLKLSQENEQESIEWEFWRHARESDMWQHLQGMFKALADEEGKLLAGVSRADRGLRAHCEYNLDLTILESERVSRGLVCLLYRPESGRWDLTRGPNEFFKSRAEVLAARAGSMLGAWSGLSPVEYWLHRTCYHLRATGSLGFFAVSDTGGIITNVCESSAIFCCWLEKKALETATISARVARYRKPDRTDPEVAKRRAIVRSNPNIATREICGALDRERVPLPMKWQEAGLRSWGKAYMNASYRRLIDTLISKARDSD